MWQGWENVSGGQGYGIDEDTMRFTHPEISFELTYDVTQKITKIKKKCFGAFFMIFIFHRKIDLIEIEPHFLNSFFNESHP